MKVFTAEGQRTQRFAESFCTVCGLGPFSRWREKAGDEGVVRRAGPHPNPLPQAGEGARSSQAQSDSLGQLSAALANACGACVRWQLVARSGVNSAQALELLHELQPQPADIAVVVLGVNDVVDRVPPALAMQARGRLADGLRDDFGVRHVVFAPLPPVHQFPGLPQPLRWMAGVEGRAHDEALAHWASGRPDTSYAPIDVTLGPDTMASDGFHPGEPVLRVCAGALATHVAAHVWPHISQQETTP